MSNGIGKKESIAVLTKVIEGLNDSISVGNKMSPTMVMETAMILEKKYWWLKVEQLAHFCLECKSGSFGAFQRFDQPTFFETLEGYIIGAENNRQDEYEELKNNNYEPRERSGLQSISEITKGLEPPK